MTPLEAATLVKIFRALSCCCWTGDRGTSGGRAGTLQTVLDALEVAAEAAAVAVAGH